jgi:hypothetical protein
MKAVGMLLSLVCVALGALEVWVSGRRHEEHFAHARGQARTILTYEFAASPAKMRALIAAAGERGREALLRCLDIDYFIMAGYVVVGLGAAGLLTGGSEPGLARFVIIATLVAAACDSIENAAIRTATRAHPAGGSTAPLATVAAVIKFALLAASVAAFLLWPWRAWFG